MRASKQSQRASKSLGERVTNDKEQVLTKEEQVTT